MGMGLRLATLAIDRRRGEGPCRCRPEDDAACAASVAGSMSLANLRFLPCDSNRTVGTRCFFFFFSSTDKPQRGRDQPGAAAAARPACGRRRLLERRVRGRSGVGDGNETASGEVPRRARPGCCSGRSRRGCGRVVIGSSGRGECCWPEGDRAGIYCAQQPQPL